MTPVSTSSASATPTHAPANNDVAPAATSGAPSADASSTTTPDVAKSAATDTFENGDASTSTSAADMCLIDAKVDPELNTVLQSQLQSQMSQARLGAPPSPGSSPGYTSDASFGTQAAQTALLFVSGATEGAFGVSDPGPAIENAIKNDARFADGNDGLTEGAELIGHGTGSIFPEWLANLGPKANIDNMHRAGKTYDNGYKEWSKSPDDGETWQRFIGRADDKPMTGNGLGYGEGLPVDDDFDVNSLKSIK